MRFEFISKKDLFLWDELINYIVQSILKRGRELLQRKRITLLLFFMPVLISAQVTVAIGDFQNRTRKLYLDSWTEKIPELLTAKMSQSNHIVLVERQSLKSIIDEQNLGMTGMVDTSNAQEIGRLLSAQYVITGTLYQIDHASYTISAKIISVKSGKTLSEQVQGPSREYLPDMVDLLAKNLLFQLTGQGERQKEIRLTQYPTRPFLWSTIASGLLTVTFQQLYSDRRKTYQEETELDQFDNKYTAANSMYRLRNGFGFLTLLSLAGTITCWANNLQPDVIYASGPQVSPYLFAGKHETVVGLSIHF